MNKRITIKISTVANDYMIDIEHLTWDLELRNGNLVTTFTFRDSDELIYDDLLKHLNVAMSKTIINFYIVDEDDSDLLIITSSNGHLFMTEDKDDYGKCIRIINMDEVI